MQTVFEQEDLFNHGAASHAMELNVIAALANHRVPIPVIVEYFNTSDEFDEQYTKQQVESVISRQYHAFSCETVWEQAEQFCLGDSCGIYRDEHDIKPYQQ